MTKPLMKSTLVAALCINTVFGNTMNTILNGQTFTVTHDAADWRAPKVVAAIANTLNLSYKSSLNIAQMRKNWRKCRMKK